MKRSGINKALKDLECGTPIHIRYFSYPLTHLLKTPMNSHY